MPAGMMLVEQQQAKHDTVKLYSDLLTATFEKSHAYMNVVTLGGYAAFFGLWSLVGSELTSKQKLWSGLLLATSVALFALFEVLKMALLHWHMRSMMKVTKAQPQTIAHRLKGFEKATKAASKTGIAIWLVVFPFTVLTGVAGGGVLLFAFITKLLA